MRRTVTLVTALLLSAGLLTPPALTGAAVSPDGPHDSRFLDIDDAPSHSSAIATLDRRDVFIGTECGFNLFCPNEPLERWALAVWLVRVLDEDVNVGAGDNRFADVDYTQWWAPFVDHLAALGITKGCSTDPALFCPSETVTRGQTASFLTRAFQLAPAEPAGFTDTEGTTHAGDIDSLADSGITKGCVVDPPQFCPNADVTRGEMASFLLRAKPEPPRPVPTSPQLRIAFTRNLGTRIYVMNADGANPRPLTTTSSWEPVWSPDGTKIAFIQRNYHDVSHSPMYRPDSYSRGVREGQIWVMAADGADKVKLADEGAYPAWSPDSSRLAFSDGYRLFVANADGSGTQQVATRARDPSWSPGGTRIVFEGTGGGIYMAASDGTGTHRLQDEGANPEWSPDGTSIAYDDPYDDDGGIHIMNPDGTGARQLTFDDGQRPRWSSDSALIIYEGVGIVVMNKDGTGRRALTEGSGAGSVFSPDGGSVAFSDPRSGLQVIDADGTDRKQLTVDHHGVDPAWSPDGNLIAYTRDLGYRVFTVGVEGGDERQLTEGPYEFNPVWSPDGKKLAFTHNPFFDFGISVINADGTRQQRITVGEGDQSPVWSPDSTRIAYSNVEGIWVINANGSDRRLILGRKYGYPDLTWSHDSGLIAYTNNGIWVMDADGTNRIQLTVGYGNEPAWSPDGTRIAFVRSDESRGLWVMDADGTGERQLASDYSKSPAWSPDSTRIAYETNRGGNTGIGVIRADGTEGRQITTDQGVAPVWSPDGTRIAYSRSFTRGGIFLVNADGADQTAFSVRDDFSPSWSPVPVP